MSLYSRYKTNESTETQGVIMDLQDVQIRILRAGGANIKYTQRLEALLKPHRRAVQANSLPRETMMGIMYQVYAETIVTDWKTLVDGEWQEGIEGPDGTLNPFNVENVIATFKALPDLFADIQEFAGNTALFLQANLEEDAKN